MRKIDLLLALAAPLLFAFHSPARPGDQDEGSQDAGEQEVAAEESAVKLGDRMSPISLNGLDGKPVELFSKADKELQVVTALVYFSVRDPLSRAAVPHLEELAKRHGSKLKLYLVAAHPDELAGSSDPLDKFRKYVKKEQVSLPIVVDKELVLADKLEVLCANHSFVFNAEHVLMYVGAIDDDPRGKLRARGREVREWFALAVDAAVAGDVPEESFTRPQGRALRRRSQGEPKPADEKKKPR